MAMNAIPPAAGGVVMGTGIVSSGLLFDDRVTFSRILLVIAAAVWIVLALVLAARSLQEPDRIRQEARTPAALTGVASTAVLGDRLTAAGWRWAGIAALVIALLLWLILIAPVLQSWSTPTVGTSLMVTVSTESLAVLAATLVRHERADWLLYAACAPFIVGLVSYALVIARFDLGQLLHGQGDHWITGGALAISALAVGQITLAARSLHQMVGLASALETVSVATWAAAVAWLPVLVGAEALRRRVRYDLNRWSTVFPVGMYAACSFAAGAAAHAHGITDFAKIWVWVSVVVWVTVFLAMLDRLRRARCSVCQTT